MKDKILVMRSSMPPYEEFINMIKPLWETHWLTNMGIYHKELEKKLKEYLDIENISLLCNGHMSLEMILQAMQLKGEVITTPFTFVSTTHAIVRNGLIPVFCDIKEEDYTIDEEKIESLITDKTCAIVPVHVYGSICNIEKIQKISDKYNLKVIYDSAHAFGEKINGKSIADFGDASIFSFHATKVFNTIEGGAVVFKDNKLGEKLYNLKNFGIRSEFEVEDIGANAKLDEFRAIMGICNLKYLDDEILKRKKVVERYRKNLYNINGIKLLNEQSNITYNYAYFPVLFDENLLGFNRDVIYDRLKQKNIFSRKYFYPLTSEFDCYRNRFRINETKVASKVAKNILTLPLYADLDLNVVDEICDLILNMILLN